MKYRLLLCLLCSVLLPLFLQAQTTTNAYFIQIASYTDPQMKQFESISKFGYIFSELQDNKLYRVMMGTYSSYNAAKKIQTQLQAKGFKDAFVVQVPIVDEDGVYIVQIATLPQKAPIYWGDWQRLSPQIMVQMSDDQLRISRGPFYSKEDANKAMADIQQKGGRNDVFVRVVSSKFLHPLSPLEIARNDVNPKAERYSIKAIQAALGQSGYYSLSIDGKWGENTQKSLDAFRAKDEIYLKYKTLAAQQKLVKEVEQFTLQYYINLIDKNPMGADEGLKQFQHPLAKAYRAYIYLNGDLQIENMQAEVNSLMNSAAEMTFKGYRQKTRYDFNMKYSYDNIAQLIKHLRAIHEAVKDEPDVPCWLFRRHPALSAEAFALYWNSERDEYKISSDCGSFLDLPQMQMLVVMANDLEASTNNNIHKINELYAYPMPLSHSEIKDLENWNAQVWKCMDNSGAKNPVLYRMHKSMRVIYFDSLRGLEDYFLKKHFSIQDARALGLKVIKQAVGENFEAYCK